MSAIDQTVAVPAERSARGLRAELAAGAAILTRVPVASAGDRTGAGAFGLIGSAVGATAAIPVLAVGSISPAVGGILAIAALVAITGALHLDGLADTTDALVAPTAEAAERARADPRAGPAAIVAIVVVLVADWSLIATMIGRRDVVAAGAVLVVGGGVSRAVVAIAPSVSRQVFRPGFGSWFAERVTLRDGLASAATALAIAVIATIGLARAGILAVTVIGVAGGLVSILVLARLRHGLDGDALGAAVELSFCTSLLAAVLVV